MMSNAELCQWLRDNSSGIYRPSAEAAAKLDRLFTTLLVIAAMNPEVDSAEGFNEWGEAECFNKAQALARDALGDA